MFLTKTYELEDCWDYDTNTYNLAPNSAIAQIDSFSFTNTGDWEVEWIMNLPQGANRVVLYNPNNTGTFLGIGASDGNIRRIYWTGSDSSHNSWSYNANHTIKIVKQNSQFKVYFNNTLLNTITFNDLLNATTINVGVRNWGNGTGTIRNVKIKPL